MPELPPQTARTPSPGRREPASRCIGILVYGASGEGSLSAIVRLQAEHLARGFRVVIFSDRFPAEATTVPVIRVDATDFRWLRRFGHVARELVTSRRLVARALQWRREAGLDLVILHSHTLAALGGSRFARAGVRSLLVAHGDIRSRPRGTYGVPLTCLYRWSNPRGYRSVDRVLALSGLFHDLAVRETGDPGRIVLLPGPVEGPWPARPRARRLEAGRQRVRLGFAGRLAPEKGLSALVDALQLLVERGTNVELAIAGNGAMEAPLRSQVDRLGLPDRVTFSGWMPREALADFFAGLDLFCMPSITENQGCAAQEALLHGVPVVAAETGGLKDLVRPGRDGELCRAGDPESIAAAILRAQRCLMSDGYVVPDPEWMERYSPEGHGQRLVTLAEELLA